MPPKVDRLVQMRCSEELYDWLHARAGFFQEKSRNTQAKRELEALMAGVEKKLAKIPDVYMNIAQDVMDSPGYPLLSYRLRKVPGDDAARLARLLAGDPALDEALSVKGWYLHMRGSVQTRSA